MAGDPFDHRARSQQAACPHAASSSLDAAPRQPAPPPSYPPKASDAKSWINSYGKDNDTCAKISTAITPPSTTGRKLLASGDSATPSASLLRSAEHVTLQGSRMAARVLLGKASGDGTLPVCGVRVVATNCTAVPCNDTAVVVTRQGSDCTVSPTPLLELRQREAAERASVAASVQGERGLSPQVAAGGVGGPKTFDERVKDLVNAIVSARDCCFGGVGRLLGQTAHQYGLCQRLHAHDHTITHAPPKHNHTHTHAPPRPVDARPASTVRPGAAGSVP